MGKSTEDTTMELDGEGAGNFEQLQDLIRKEYDKRDRKFAQIEDKYNKLEQQVTQKDQQKNMEQRVRPSNNERSGASKKNISNKRQAANKQSTRPRSAPTNTSGQQKPAKLRKPRTSRRKNSGSRLRNKNKPPSPLQNKFNRNPPNTTIKEKPAKEASTKKLIAQFGFVNDPTLSIQNNMSITLSTMPTWYYFSCPPNLAFHDFTKKHKHEKNYDHY